LPRRARHQTGSAARDAGLPLVAIGAIFQRIDVAFIAKREAGMPGCSPDPIVADGAPLFSIA
jgi:hypothetical protein